MKITKPFIQIYTPQKTARLEYIVEFLFREILGCGYTIITNVKDVKKSGTPVINYSYEQVQDSLNIKPHSLLFEDNIQAQQINISRWHDIPVFFATDTSAEIPFDIFSASFYLITRYEEYIVDAFDNHGRFKHESSVAFQNGFLQDPVIDMWMMELKKILSEKYPGFEFPKREFRNIPTIDIDNAWAYLHKPWYRKTRAAILDILRGNFKGIKERLNVLSGKIQDPYDSYEFISHIYTYGVKPLIFFLLGRYSKYDKNLSSQNPKMVELIQRLDEVGELGIHPSYLSNQKHEQLTREKQQLGKITGNDITRSRQHFLKFRLPGTYRKLIKEGITDDYSMGYTRMSGFRAGTCTPFMFFDLESNASTSLKVHSTVYMDLMLREYMGFSTSDAMNHLQIIKEKIQSVGGIMMGIWHNESLSDNGVWNGWREVFERTMNNR